MTSNAVQHRIRPATLEDVPAVLDLFDQAIEWFKTFGNDRQWGTEPFSRQSRQVERVTSWLGSSGGWIAEVPAVPVAGVIVLGDRHDYVPAVDGNELHVRLLLSARVPQAKGTGRALLAFADKQAASKGIDRLRVDCYNGGNGRLPEFYESCGYRRTETFTVRDWPGQLLERRLPLSDRDERQPSLGKRGESVIQEPAVRLTGVTKTFGSVTVVDHLDRLEAEGRLRGVPR